MSPHTQFWIATLLSIVGTLPFVGLAWRQRTPHLRLVLALYTAGYGLIVGTLFVDSFINPPLLLHGFFPGVGCGLIVVAFGQYVTDLQWKSKPQSPIPPGSS